MTCADGIYRAEDISTPFQKMFVCCVEKPTADGVSVVVVFSACTSVTKLCFKANP